MSPRIINLLRNGDVESNKAVDERVERADKVRAKLRWHRKENHLGEALTWAFPPRRKTP